MNLTRKQAYAMGMDLAIISSLKTKKTTKHNTYLSDVPIIKKRRIITGFDILDKELPKNGIPKNSLIVVFGPYSSGKSYVIYNIIRANNLNVPIDIKSPWKSEVITIHSNEKQSTLNIDSRPKSSADIGSMKKTNSVTGDISFVSIHTGYSQIKNLTELPNEIVNNSEIIISLRIINDSTIAYVLKNDFGELCRFPICSHI